MKRPWARRRRILPAVQRQFLDPRHRLSCCRMRVALVDRRHVFRTFEPLDLKAPLPLIIARPIQSLLSHASAMFPNSRVNSRTLSWKSYGCS